MVLFGVAAVPGWAQLRQEVNLSGEWEYARVEELTQPPAEGWLAIHVPGLIRGVDYERAWFRTDFVVPETMRGMRIELHFGGVKFNSIVMVNGEKVGGHFGGHESFDVDITAVAKVGETNRLDLGCHDWTGVFIDNETDFSVMKERPMRSREIPKDKILAPIGGHNEQFGPWDDVKLQAHPAVYVKDLFIKPSVREKQLQIDYELANLDDASAEVVLGVEVLDGDEVVLSGPKAGASELPPGGSVHRTVTIPWENPRTWSHEDRTFTSCGRR